MNNPFEAGMVGNYLKVSLRNFLRYKLYTLINVFGLAMGLASCLLIGLFVWHELSYDRHYAKAERIYLVSLDFFPPSRDTVRFSTNFPPVAPLLRQDFPQIEQTARLNRAPEVLLGRDGASFYESQLRYVDASFFELFDFEWLLGNASTALAGPASVVLTESLAEKYFGDENPLGMTLTLEDRLPLQVTGVIADLPGNTHLSASGFASIELMEALYGSNTERYLASWNNLNTYTYILLKPDAGIEDIERELSSFAERHVPDEGFPSAMQLTALKDIHLAPDTNNELKAPGNLSTIIIFSAIGFCILAIACINFVNLSTARSSQRALEVGLRKSIGAARIQLIRQFLGESLCLTGLAMLIALALAEFLLPVVNGFIEQDLAFDFLGEPLAIPGLVGATLLLGVLAGAYPAFSLSAFAPARVLKGEFTRGKSGLLLRDALVVLQFAASIILLVVTVTIFSQMNYISKLDLGFRKDQVVVLYLPNGGIEQWLPFKQQLLSHPEIIRLSSSSSTPLRDIDRVTSVRKEGEADAQSLTEISIDQDYFGIYDIAFLAGGFGAGEEGSPGGDGLILNEQAARLYGWTPGEALGKLLEHRGVWKPVVGVVNNTIESASSNSSPTLYQFPEEAPAGSVVSIRLAGNGLDGALDHIDRTWSQWYPARAVERRFLDGMVEALYQEERQDLLLSFYFSALSIGIACLGLFGLAVYNAERRTREIGVRKVMGGSVWSIVLLLTNDFSKLVLIANVISWPVAYFAMNRWLENFAYRIDLTPLIFIGSGLIALCIAWVTVGGTAAKVASAKPVLALRYE